MTGYSETSDKGHFERGQSSQQKDKPKVYSLYRKLPLKEDNLSTEDKVAGPEGVLFKRFHCISKLYMTRNGKRENQPLNQP